MKKSNYIVLKHTSPFLIWVLIVALLSGCTKLVEIDSPGTSVSDKDVFRYNTTAIGAVTVLYSTMSAAWTNYDGEITTLSACAGLSADEFTLHSGSGGLRLSAYYENDLNSSVVDFMDFWSTLYKNLYRVNAALQGIEASDDLTPAVKQQLLGEVRFMRAFYYFYLVNLYGNVPLILGTDYAVNTLAPKSPEKTVYQQIITDLLEAQKLLSDKYLTADLINAYPAGSAERIRPTKWAATALLARTYLYQKDWLNAEKQATLVLNNTSDYKLEGLNSAFLKNNKEAIWQLQPVNSGFNTMEAYAFILPEDGPGWDQSYYLSEDLLESFDTEDLRKTHWINSVTANGEIYHYPYKYKINAYQAPVNEYSTVMRLGEQYLIRAEARAQLGNINDAIDDVDKIRDRAGLPLLKDVNPNIEKEDLLTELLKERQHELFTEWGHRWLDLKRTGQIDAVMKMVTPKKKTGATWESHMQWYPIYFVELLNNPSIKQVPGYPN